MRSRRRLRIRYASRSRVERSAQCRSSIAITAGASSPRRPSIASTSSSRRAGVSGAAGSRTARAGPSTASSASGSSSRSSWRRIAASGACGSSPSPSSMQLPISTRVPPALARAANSASRRVLPMPASPLTRTVDAAPPRAAASAASSASSCSARPTKTGLEMRRTTRRLSPRRGARRQRRGAPADVGIVSAMPTSTASTPSAGVTRSSHGAPRTADGRVSGRDGVHVAALAT